MRLTIIPLLFLVQLAGCSREPDVDLKNASVGEVANEVAAAGGSEQYLRPGKWQTKVTVEDVDIPGVPAAQQAQMKGMFGDQNVIVDQCLTPEEARRPGGEFFTGKESKDCRYERFTMAGGKIDAVMRCAGEQGGTMTMSVTGSYAPENSATRSEMKLNGDRGSMTIKALVEARRLGECDAEAK